MQWKRKKTDRGEQGKGDKREEGKTLDFIYICGYLYVWIYENDVRELAP